jgi:oligoendopeptidase F
MKKNGTFRYKLILGMAAFLLSWYTSSNTVTGSKNMTLNTSVPSWNLTDLFPGYDHPAVERHLQQLDKDVAIFVSSYKEKVAVLSAAELVTAIQAYEALSDQMGKISAYAYLLYAQDRSDTNISVFYQNMYEHTNRLSTDMLFFTLELNLLSDQQLAALYALEPLLVRYKPWISNVRLFKDHQLSDEMERLMQEKSIPAEGSWIRLYDEVCADMRFDMGGTMYPISEVLNRMVHNDENVRKTAAMALSKGLKDNARVFAMIMNTLSQNLSLDNKWRKFPTVDGSRHLSNQIDPEVVAALTTAVKNSYRTLSHRYYALKAKRFGKAKLQYWDRNAPYPAAPETDISWDKAKDIVLQAYSAFSPEMSAIAAQFFDRRWIDGTLRPGKDSGAFSHPVVPSAHPYILMNYHGKQRCVMTLAHELGHGIHQVLAKDQGALMADTPLTLAETASVFGEMLTFQSLLKQATPEQKQYLLAGKIEDMLNTVVRQVAFYEFEKRLHTARQKGELSVADISEIWMSVQSESLGDAIQMDETYDIYWAYISHFYHAPFYVYAYAFGDCLVNSLYAYYQENPTGFQDKYMTLLKAGGSKRYDEALKPFGFDLKDPAFWTKGLSMIEGFIQEFEQLSK